mgnify:CR=1 FL=1
MKRSLLLAGILLAGYHLAAQPTADSCRVLLKEISGTYSGGCVNGLAEGKGKATGEDTYAGSFRQGLPDGKGVYTYKNGNVYTGGFSGGKKEGKGKFRVQINGEFTTVSGYWKNGDYMGTAAPVDDDYRVTNRTGIEDMTILRKDNEQNVVEISFEKVMRKYIPPDLEVTFSSGFRQDQPLKIVSSGFNLPMTCSLHFTVLRNMIRQECRLDFDLLKPGEYEVHVVNN